LVEAALFTKVWYFSRSPLWAFQNSHSLAYEKLKKKTYSWLYMR